MCLILVWVLYDRFCGQLGLQFWAPKPTKIQPAKIQLAKLVDLLDCWLIDGFLLSCQRHGGGDALAHWIDKKTYIVRA